MMQYLCPLCIILINLGQEYHSCSFNDPENPFVPMLEGVPTRPDIFLAASLENAHKLQLLAAVGRINNNYLISYG